MYSEEKPDESLHIFCVGVRPNITRSAKNISGIFASEAQSQAGLLVCDNDNTGL